MKIRSRLVALALCTWLGVGLTSARAGDAGPAADAHALFDDYWQWVLREHPDAATLYFGSHQYDDRLRDESASAVMRRRAAIEAFRARSAAIDAARLSPQDRISLRVLRYELDAAAAINARYGPLPFASGDSWAPVTQLEGLQVELRMLAVGGRFESVSDYESWLKRLEAVPEALEQLQARLQVARDAAWMPSRTAILRVPPQIDAQLVDDPRESPGFLPFESFAKGVPAAEQARLAAAAERVIREQVIPAFRSFKRFYEVDYLPRAPQQAPASSLPGGVGYYQALLDWNTTTRLSAREIHDLGLAEVARIGTQMDGVVRAAGFRGSRQAYQQFLSTDPQFFFTNAQDMLAAYRDIGKRADAMLPRLFAELPREPYGVRAVPAAEGDTPSRYISGSPEGGRPGWFEANVNNLRAEPRWAMETLLLHEAVPGHHLQVARAHELGQLPAFRRHAFFNAYGEGWALYAESLGNEMGFYPDPSRKFGNLSYEMLRACRLVVDTGLHAFGWTREQAIDYMLVHTGQPRATITAEVDRYLVWPGQATAYKIGQLKIVELRDRARTRLGDRFDLRRFHNAVIDNGSLPLAVLEDVIDEWIVAEAARPPGPR